MSLICFIDESGDHNLDLIKLDNQYNVFVLSAVIFNQKDYDDFDLKFKALKKELFGSDDFVVHTKEMVRPHTSKDKRYLNYRRSDFRGLFYDKMNALIEQSPFFMVSCCIRKDKLVDKYGIKAHNPYYIALENLINRVLYFCNGQTKQNCEIYPEKRGFLEDSNLRMEYLGLQTNGVRFFNGRKMRDLIAKFELVDKSENLSGNQLADLVVTPIGRHIVGKKPKPKGNEIEYEILKTKIKRPDHFVIFP